MTTYKSNISKNKIIKVIEEAENKAQLFYDYEIHSELHKILKYDISPDVFKNLLAKLISKQFKEYESIKNYYKASNEQFQSLITYPNLKGTEKLTDKDRIDFISTYLMSWVEWKPESSDEIELKLEFVEQMKCLSDIVFETRTAELIRDSHIYLLKNLNENHKEERLTKQIPHKEKPLTQPEIAILFSFNNQTIDEGNAAKIARIFQYSAKNSGKTLLENFWEYGFKTSRDRMLSTKQSVSADNNMKKRIQNVINFKGKDEQTKYEITDDGLKSANKELEELNESISKKKVTTSEPLPNQ